MKNNKIIELPNHIIKKFSVSNFLENITYILKELLENSCDAKSAKIIITINTKKNYIQVIDNGEGIDKSDLKKLTLKYHTNKIKDLESLNNIITYGFKGESLHSINLFFPLEIVSKTSYQNVSWKIIFNKYSNIKNIEPETRINGTSIKIKDVNSLKNKTIIKNLYNVVKIMALANFATQFILYKNSKEILNLPSCENLDNKINRFKIIIKNKFLKNSIDVKYIHNLIKISGFFTFGDTSENIFLFKYIFINNRFVKISMLDEIFINSISKIKQKFSIGYCIYLDIKLDLSEIILDAEKINITFKKNKEFYMIFSDFVDKYIFKYNDFFYLNKNNIINIPDNINKKNYTTFSSKLTTDMIIKETNAILTIVKNDIIFFQLNNKIFTVKASTLRNRFIIKKCIDEFTKNNKLLSQNIDMIKYYNIKNNLNIITTNKFIQQYGFKFKIINNQTILLTSIPNILQNYYIDWDILLNELLMYLSKSITHYFSKNRFDMSIVKIFINNIDEKSPFLNFEINDLYKELVYTYHSELKWFKKNCIVIY